MYNAGSGLDHVSDVQCDGLHGQSDDYRNVGEDAYGNCKHYGYRERFAGYNYDASAGDGGNRGHSL
jgi:hypothetical protein